MAGYLSPTGENEQKIWKVSAEKSLPNHENEIFFANFFFITSVNTGSPSPPNLAAIRSREVGLPEKTTVNVLFSSHGSIFHELAENSVFSGLIQAGEKPI